MPAGLGHGSPLRTLQPSAQRWRPPWLRCDPARTNRRSQWRTRSPPCRQSRRSIGNLGTSSGVTWRVHFGPRGHAIERRPTAGPRQQGARREAAWRWPCSGWRVHCTPSTTTPRQRMAWLSKAHEIVAPICVRSCEAPDCGTGLLAGTSRGSLQRMSIMGKTQAGASDAVFNNLDGMLADLEALYKDVHSHPELSMQENAHRRPGGGPAARRRLRSHDAASARPASSACCATAMGRRSCCAPTWMRCRSKRRPACRMRAR